MTKPNVIEMHDITKKFGEFVANDHINLDVRPGEIHALLGENGAGKSYVLGKLNAEEDRKYKKINDINIQKDKSKQYK